jgi:hypothetical protein
MNQERLAELLVKETTEGLDSSELRELESLLASHPAIERDTLERTAAAVMLAGRLDQPPLSPSLRERLIAQGEGALSARAADTVVPLPPRGQSMPSRADRPWGWWVAAASLMLVVAGWWPQLMQKPSAPTVSTTLPPSTLAHRRSTLLASAAALLRLDWTATQDPAAVNARGDVVWDNATQTGYMRFEGLAANDPAQQQYQLWIFDAERGDTYPVDGGVFDVPAGQAEVVVPITAKIRVGKPALFAVTVERPGGVVVSARERIVVLAKVGAG